MSDASAAGPGGRHRRTRADRSLLALTPRAIGAVALVAATSGAAVQGGASATAAPGSSPVAVQLPRVAPAGSHADAARAELLQPRRVRISRDSSRRALGAPAQKVARQTHKDAWQLPIPRGVYHLTARFGECSGLWSSCHTGLDFAAPIGTPIHAVASGRIVKVGWAGDYGNRTVERLKDGTVLWYAHQNSTAVAVGQQVAGGRVIGYVGETGNATGPHLHLEVRPGGGDPVDPYHALSVRGVTP